MNRLTMATKGCCQLTSNETYFADSWFIGVKTVDEAMDQGVNYCGHVKSSHKGFSSCIRKVDGVLANGVISCY